ncbi:MAG: hypothetical protein V7736_18685 [Colwellia polaris]|jgi:hypothetical protein|uniref:hypothetical protein n=1 Tax=Colwellia polaris TaxID=326537 RepID=UPI000A16E41C|nr:hypothetical protein [Colwellia polaris]|tara:strand:- start:832 stop:1134 length:303 start_codon:yes stop_codon:yes gene_type:complete
MKKVCPSCKNKSDLTLLKKAKSIIVGNQYQCSNCQVILSWDRLSHYLSLALPVLLIVPTLVINVVELSRQQTINLYVGFALVSLVLLIFGFCRRYLVVNL